MALDALRGGDLDRAAGDRHATHCGLARRRLEHGHQPRVAPAHAQQVERRLAPAARDARPLGAEQLGRGAEMQRQPRAGRRVLDHDGHRAPPFGDEALHA